MIARAMLLSMLLLAGIGSTSASGIYGYAYGGTQYQTLEEAEAALHAESFAGAGVMELAFPDPGNILASTGGRLDYRQYGAIGSNASVLSPPAVLATAEFRLTTIGWPPVSTHPSCSTQWAACPSGDCPSVTALRDAAVCEFSSTWRIQPTSTSPGYCWDIQGTPSLTTNFGPPQVQNVGQASGTFLYRTTATATNWLAKLGITATLCAGTRFGDDSGKSLDVTETFSWNLEQEQPITCPDGTTIQPGASSGANACSVGLRKELIDPPEITQTPPQCDANGNSEGEGNPCFPGNGNKLVDEPGFSYGAIGLSLHYSSLRQTRRYAYIDRNWSHTYAKRILTAWSVTDSHLGTNLETSPIDTVQYVFFQDERANLEQFARIQDGVFRSTATVGKVIRYFPASGGTGARYELSYPDASKDVFDRAGRLVEVRPLNPTKNLVLTYLGQPVPVSGTIFQSSVHMSEEFWRVQSITDGGGRQVQFTYSGAPSWWLTGIQTDTSQPLLNFSYDASHRLIAVSHAALGTRQYLYNEPLHTFVGGVVPASNFGYWLTGVIDEQGRRYATYKYDDWGRVISSWHGDEAGKVSIEYLNDTQVRVTYASGRQKTITYNAIGGYRQKASESDQDGTVHYGYTSGRQTLLTDRNGTQTKLEYNATNERVIKRTEALGLPEQRRIETDPHPTLGVVVERRVYSDPSNSGIGTLEQRTTYSYDSLSGRLLGMTEVDPVNSSTRSWTYTYCTTADVGNHAGTGCAVAGALRSVNGPRTDVSDLTSYTYRPSPDVSGCATTTGACHRLGDLWKVTNALNQVTQILKYDRAGRIVRTQDANGVVTDYEYNARGWLLKKFVRGINNAIESDDAITIYTRDTSGLVTRITAPDLSFQEFSYDAAQRVDAILNNAAESVALTLNDDGEATLIEVRDSSSTLKRSLTRTFDPFGRLESETNATGGATSFGYDVDGNRTYTAPPTHGTTAVDYDALNRVSATIQDADRPIGVRPGPFLEATTSMTYDARDNIRSVTDPNQLITSYSFDGFNDLRELASPDTGTTLYVYNQAGRVATRTDARGSTATYSYDSLDRLVGISYPDVSQNVSYTYDSVLSEAPCTANFPVGRLVRVVEQSGGIYFCYDNRGNVVKRKQHVGLAAMTTVYEYSLANRLKTVTYPSGQTVTIGRDSVGRATSVTVGGSPLISSVSYLPFGPAGTLQFGGGSLPVSTLSRSFDQNYRMTTIDSSLASGLDLRLMYDQSGYVVGTRNDLITTLATETYQYDDIGRLSLVEDKNGLDILTLNYDLTGNRTSKQLGSALPQIYKYSATSHHLDQVGGDTRTYSPAGNTAEIGADWSFTYDYANRMTTSVAFGVSAAHSFNGLGQRVRKGTASTELIYTYDESGRILGEYTTYIANQKTVTAPVAEFIYMDDILIGVVNWTPNFSPVTDEYVDSTPHLHFVHADHLGTPRAVVDPARGVAVWRWELQSDPFGETAPSSDPDLDATAYNFGPRFPGQWFDQETGLHYNYFRNYEPSTGRFVESDPIGLAAGPSTYAYTSSNPLISTDPTGLSGIIVAVRPGVWIRPVPTGLRPNPLAEAIRQGIQEMPPRPLTPLEQARILAEEAGVPPRGPLKPEIRQPPRYYPEIPTGKKDFIDALVEGLNLLGGPKALGPIGAPAESVCPEAEPKPLPPVYDMYCMAYPGQMCEMAIRDRNLDGA